MLLTILVCQISWLSSSSVVTRKVFGDTYRVLETPQQYEGPPVRRIVAAEFYQENTTLLLQREDGQKIVANLEVEDDCIFRGSMVGCTASTVLVTGCRGGLQGVQIQSQLFGDIMFTMLEGVVMPLESKRSKRDSDIDFDDYDDVLHNPEFENLFANLENLEAGDLPSPPTKVELHLNVYLDKFWASEMGRRAGPEIAKKILKHAALLLKHETLNTKIELFYDQTKLYTSSEHLLPGATVYNTKLPKQLVGPNLTTAGEPTAHLYLTVDGETEKSRILGTSQLNSMCGFEKPRVIVIYKNNEVRTAMTVAHELGHLLGLRHDFDLHDFDEGSKKCGKGKFTGSLVMNYGDNRQSFSECSNLDFKTYYRRVVLEHGGFCLSEGVLGCHCNGVVNTIGQFGKCTGVPLGTFCHVHEDSGCKDIIKFNGKFLSAFPCKSTNSQKENRKKTTRTKPTKTTTTITTTTTRTTTTKTTTAITTTAGVHAMADSLCDYKCEPQGSCTVEYAGPFRPFLSTSGSCFSASWGSHTPCSGTPPECLPCNEALLCPE